MASPLTRPQHDVVFNNLAVHNQARYSPALLPIPDGEKDETEVVAQLAAIAAGIVSGEEPTAAQIDDLIAYTVAAQAGNDAASQAHGRSPEELLEAVAHRSGVDRILDLRIRSGPYGDGFGAYPDGLTLQHLIDPPESISGRCNLACPRSCGPRPGTLMLRRPCYWMRSPATVLHRDSPWWAGVNCAATTRG